MQDLETEVAEKMKLLEWRANNEGCHPAVRATAKAHMDTLKTAPRDLPKLKMAIALKQKAYNICKDWLQRDILRAELDALQSLVPVINLRI